MGWSLLDCFLMPALQGGLISVMGALRLPRWPWSLAVRGKSNHNQEKVFSASFFGTCMLFYWFIYEYKSQITQQWSMFSKYLLVFSRKWTPLFSAPKPVIGRLGQQPLPSTMWGHSQSPLSSVLSTQPCLTPYMQRVDISQQQCVKN